MGRIKQFDIGPGRRCPVVDSVDDDVRSSTLWDGGTGCKLSEPIGHDGHGGRPSLDDDIGYICVSEIDVTEWRRDGILYRRWGPSRQTSEVFRGGDVSRGVPRIQTLTETVTQRDIDVP